MEESCLLAGWARAVKHGGGFNPGWPKERAFLEEIMTVRDLEKVSSDQWGGGKVYQAQEIAGAESCRSEAGTVGTSSGLCGWSISCEGRTEDPGAER